MSPTTRLLRGAAAGVMSLGALTLTASALALLRDGRIADWVPNLPSSPMTVIAGLGAFVGGAIARRRLRPSITDRYRIPCEDPRNGA